MKNFLFSVSSGEAFFESEGGGSFFDVESVGELLDELGFELQDTAVRGKYEVVKK